MRSETLIACTAILLPLTLHPPPPGILPLRLWVLILPIPPPPSPTHPSPQYPAGPFFPYLFPASSPGFLRGCGPSHLPAWLHPPRLRLLQTPLLPNGRVPAGGGRVLGDPEGPAPTPVGFLPTFSGTLPCLPLPRMSPADSISPVHPSHPPLGLTLPYLQRLPTSFPSSPFPFLSSQVLLPPPFLCPDSVQPAPCSLPLSPSSSPPISTPFTPAFPLPRPALPFSPQPFPSPSPPPLSPSPRLFRPP